MSVETEVVTSEAQDLAERDAEGDRYNRRIRLDILEGAAGMNSVQKWMFHVLKSIIGQMPNPALVCSYHRSLFGKWYVHFTQRALRESAFWKKEELELFAAYTANRLKCDY